MRYLIPYSFSHNSEVSLIKSFLIEYAKIFVSLTTEGKLNKLKTQIEKYSKELKNFYFSAAYQQAMGYLDYLIKEPAYEPSSKLGFLEEKLGLNELTSFVSNYLKKIRFTWLVQGNISKEDSLELTNSVEDFVKRDLLPEEDANITRIACLPNNVNYYYILPSQNKNNENSSLITYYQFGKLSIKDQCCALVVENLLRDKFFDDLRTKQQLGYVASLFLKESRKIQGLICVVQGNAKPPEYVKNSVNKFFENANKDVLNLSDTDFKDNVNSVIIEKKQKDLKLFEEASRNFGEIQKKDFEFDYREKHIAILEKLEKKELISFWEEHFINNKKILDVELLADNHKAENEKIENENNVYMLENMKVQRSQVKSIVDFKRKVSLYPDYFIKK